jgi:hypothetical protein
MAVSFIERGNWSARSLTNFITSCYIEYMCTSLEQTTTKPAIDIVEVLDINEKLDLLPE